MPTGQVTCPAQGQQVLAGQQANCLIYRQTYYHYQNCEETRCKACGPVRELIQLSSTLDAQITQMNEDVMSTLQVQLGFPFNSRVAKQSAVSCA